VRRSALFTALLALLPRAALACPVCFGQNDSPMALGINYGILVMLGFIGSVLAGFAAFFVYLMRRSRLAEQLSLEAGGPGAGHGPERRSHSPLAADLGPQVPQVQEGTI
jgi:hypothetical protein